MPLDEMTRHNPIRDHISHIPKVVTQHGCFLASKDTPVITKKPNQEVCEGRTYYTVESKPERYNYINHQKNCQSTYADCFAQTTQLEHYRNPQKPLIPAALRRQKEVMQDRAENPVDTGIGKLWNSMYRSTYNRDEELRDACKKYKRLRGPPFSVAHPPQCLSEEKSMTCYSADYGLLGSKPTDKLIVPAYTYNGRIKTEDSGWTRVVEVKEIADDTIMKKVGDVIEGNVRERPDLKSVEKLPTVKHDLTRGTTRATFHIPGYQGFLPTNTNNPRCAEIESGLQTRKPWTSISEQYHLNLPGYSGHIPQSAINDKGTRQISTMTVMGRDYSRNAGFVR